MKYNLLIIYKDGKQKIIGGVAEYGLSEMGTFWFKKNGYRGFVPMRQVRFFGREFDYD